MYLLLVLTPHLFLGNKDFVSHLFPISHYILANDNYDFANVVFDCVVVLLDIRQISFMLVDVFLVS